MGKLFPEKTFRFSPMNLFYLLLLLLLENKFWEESLSFKVKKKKSERGIETLYS